MRSAFESGKSAEASALVHDLPSASALYLEGALENPGLQPELVALVLKSRAVTTSLIQRIARNPAWMQPYEVKSAVVLHPRTPRSIAMNLIQFLWWRDLARVADHAALAAPLRRAAERLLAIRMQELALGEKMSLARIVGRGVIGVLRKDENPMVIRALLQNPRLTEDDALAMAGAVSTSGPVLKTLAEDGRFSSRPAIQKAIVQHRDTPAAVALRILRKLSTQALKEVARRSNAPRLVKVAAGRLIDEREKRD